MKKDISQTEIIRIAAEAAAKTTIEVYNKQIHKAQVERVDKRLRNTKLLLRNYRMFKAHCENAVYELGMDDYEDENIYDILDRLNNEETEFFVESIRKSVARTAIMVKHIDAMLQYYEIFCTKSNNPEEERRYQVIYTHYIDENPKTINQLADQFIITDRTIYRDIDIACERISALLFGIDGIKKT